MPVGTVFMKEETDMATLQEDCTEIVKAFITLRDEFIKALIETRCFLFGHRWRCLGRWQNPPAPEAGEYPRSLMSVWDCERPGCDATDNQQWDI